MGKSEGEKWAKITIPESLYKEAERWAELWGCTVEEFVNEALSQMVSEEKKRQK